MPAEKKTEARVAESLPPGAVARFGTTRYRASMRFWYGSFCAMAGGSSPGRTASSCGTSKLACPDKSARREAASKALAEAGVLIELAIRKALAGKPTAEARERLEKILHAVNHTPTRDDLLHSRAVSPPWNSRTRRRPARC